MRCFGKDQFNMSRNEERILNEIRRVGPDWISNSQLESRTGISPHQQVFQITRKLMRKGQINGEQRGKEWFFQNRQEAESGREDGSAHLLRSNAFTGNSDDPADAHGTETDSSKLCRLFEARARNAMSVHYGVTLSERVLPGVPKRFDCASADGSIVGDAKYFNMVRGTKIPPAKFSIIAEHVWLLEKTKARCKFLIFGNNRLIPTRWLEKYRHLAVEVAFWFLDSDGVLEELSPANLARLRLAWVRSIARLTLDPCSRIVRYNVSSRYQSRKIPLRAASGQSYHRR